MTTITDFQQIVCPYSASNLRNSEGDLIELSDGRILLGWSQFIGGHEDHSTAHIGGKISDDGGYTWSEPFILQPNMGKQTTMSLSFLRVDDSILMFYLVKEDINTDCICYMRKSKDEGQTWEEPYKIFTDPGYYVVNNARVILTSRNRIIIPAAYYTNIRQGNSFGICYYSDDGGISWHRGKGRVYLENSKTGIQEPGLVELKDGSLMMIIRSDRGYIYKSRSCDHGDTWSEPEATPLVSCISPATIKRIPNTDKLLIIWNPNVFGKNASWRDRWPLCSAISKDEGDTWENIKFLETYPQKAHAYTSITFIKDKAYLTYYEWNRLPGKQNFEGTCLKLRIIDKEWFIE